jgi:hypothetical protein
VGGKSNVGIGPPAVGILIAAGIATAIALCGLAVLLIRAEDWRPVALASLIALPLQPLAFYFMRLPIDGVLKLIFGASGWIVIVSLFYAPLTEEPAKWVVAVVPPVHRAIMRSPVRLALAVGIGFAIGEFWFLAVAIALSPNYPDLPFWMFQPYIIERLEACFLHGAFVSLPFVALARGRPFWLGGLAGMVLHFLLNFPIYLAQIDAFGLGREVWGVVLTLWILGFVVVCALMVWYLARSMRKALAQG